MGSLINSIFPRLGIRLGSNPSTATKSMKHLLFSLTAKDFTFTSMTAGGPGGQHQNRSQTAIRCLHKESGAQGVARDEKSQLCNKRAAFVRCVSTSEFKRWHRTECARRLGQKLPETKEEILARVDRTISDGIVNGDILFEVVEGI